MNSSLEPRAERPVTQRKKQPRIVLTWRRFQAFGQMCAELAGKPCIYLITDSSERPLRFGETSDPGRYRGSQSSLIDAALHGSGNRVFAATVRGKHATRTQRRRAAVWSLADRYSAPYRDRRAELWGRPPMLTHHGDVPRGVKSEAAVLAGRWPPDQPNPAPAVSWHFSRVAEPARAAPVMLTRPPTLSAPGSEYGGQLG
jgi:hypothetical protein